MRRNEIKRSLKHKAMEHIVDVTLSDCANNPRKVAFRRVKGNLNNIAGKPTLSEEDPVDDELLEETNKPSLMSHSPKNKRIEKPKEEYGALYPSDLWFLIARYIPPEDLARFALICKDAYRVVLSAHFWMQLCKRYKGDDASLPRDLRYPCDSRRGLRTRTIRLLYIRCPSLNKLINPPVAPRYEPYTLRGMRLILAWHEKEGKTWNFYFKWMSRDTDEGKHYKNEIFENPEAGCRVLKVTCNEFMRFPYPQYSYLSSIHLGLTSDMRHQKLSLGFSDYTTTHCAAKMKETLGRSNIVQHQVVLEPIERCVLMDWWHPKYPHPRENPCSLLLPCSTEEW